MLIDALRGRPAAGRLRDMGRASSPVPFVCAVNVEELVRGLRADEERLLERLLAGLRMAPLGGVEGERAGSWRRAFAATGVTLSQSDCLVAAAAAGVGARLASGNPRRFPMPELGVDHWPVGE